MNIPRTNLNFRDSQDGHLCIRGNEVRPRHSRNLWSPGFRPSYIVGPTRSLFLPQTEYLRKRNTSASWVHINRHPISGRIHGPRCSRPRLLRLIQLVPEQTRVVGLGGVKALGRFSFALLPLRAELLAQLKRLSVGKWPGNSEKPRGGKEGFTGERCALIDVTTTAQQTARAVR